MELTLDWFVCDLILDPTDLIWPVLKEFVLSL